MTGAPADSAPLLSLRGIHKRSPGVHALKGVDLEVRAGEVHAVVGENGAGKSTLMQILAGVHRPDAGRIDFAGAADVLPPDERAARDLGIALVFQERSLFGPLSLAENIFADRQPPRRFGRIDRAGLAALTRALLDVVGLSVPPETPVERLAPAQQQQQQQPVEVAKALSTSPRLILFDEPTASLTPGETGRLFGIIGRLRARGVGVIYISHRLEEVFALADRVTALKDGAGQETFGRSELTPAGLVARMVGRGVNPRQVVAGVFDLSVGSMISMTGAVAGRLMARGGWPVPAAVPAALGLAAPGGLVKGLLVARMRVNALITTLGTLGVFQGVAILIAGPGVANLPPGFTALGRAESLTLQASVWLMLGLALLAHYLLGHTRPGRQLYYVGSNARAARLSGIGVDRVQVAAFTAMGLIVGLPGLAFAARVGTAVSTAGAGAELRVITAVILGGASPSGGKGRVLGALIGVAFMALANNALIVTRVSSYWQGIVVGAILVLAVAFDSYQNRPGDS